MQELYEKAARAAYENSLALLYEARLLARRSRFARAYALCVLSAEEHYKYFLYKSVSAGLIPASLIRHWVIDHEEKILGLIHLVVVPWVLAYHIEEIREALDRDRTEPDHSKHAYPSVMDWVNKTSPSLVRRLTSVLKHAHDLKLRALYVDSVKGKVIAPPDINWERKFYKIHSVLDGFVRSDYFLGLDDKEFRKMVEDYDPDFPRMFKRFRVKDKIAKALVRIPATGY